jgi:hypothetical protein
MAGEQQAAPAQITNMKTTPMGMILKCGLLALGFGASVASAWHISGKVVCDDNGNQQIDTTDMPIKGVMVAVENVSGTFSAVVTTADDGTFHLELPHNADSYLAYLHPPTIPPGATLLLPTGSVFAFSLTDDHQFFEQANFLLDCDHDQPPAGEADCGKVTGGGWILTASGSKVTFGVSGGTKDAGFWGHLNLVDHATGLHVRSTAVTGYDQDPTDADGRIIHYNVVIGTASGTAVVRVVDNGEPGARDIFEVTLSTGYSARGELGGGRPGGGNIQLHKCPPGRSK